jgi:hypothetical protein
MRLRTRRRRASNVVVERKVRPRLSFECIFMW